MKKINIIILIVIGLSISGSIQAQIYSNNNLYFADLYSFNPAAAQFKTEMNVALNTNISNAGFEGAPSKVMLMVNGPFSDKVGLGLRLFKDTRGAFNTSSVLASYAYKIKLAPEDNTLALGLSAGIYMQNFDVSEINVLNYNDQNLIDAGDYRKRHFVNEFGALYKWKKLTIGFAAPYVVQLYNHYIGYLSYDYDLPSLVDFTITPMVLLQHLPEGNNQIDGGLKFKYKPAWIAFTYRSNKNFLTGLGFSYNKFDLAYSFEINNKELSNLSGSTHEIMLQYHFNLQFKSRKPSYDKENMPWEEEKK